MKALQAAAPPTRSSSPRQFARGNRPSTRSHALSLLGANVYFQSETLDLSGLSDTVRTSNSVELTTGLY